MKVHLPPSKILDLRLRISEALAILRLARGLAALALPIQANERTQASPFLNWNNLRLPWYSMFCSKSQKSHSERLLSLWRRKVGTMGLRVHCEQVGDCCLPSHGDPLCEAAPPGRWISVCLPRVSSSLEWKTHSPLVVPKICDTLLLNLPLALTSPFPRCSLHLGKAHWLSFASHPSPWLTGGCWNAKCKLWRCDSVSQHLKIPLSPQSCGDGQQSYCWKTPGKRSTFSLGC